MRAATRHRVSLLIYVALVAVVVVALFGYQRHTNNKFESRDHTSCLNRQILFANQMLVTRYLHAHAGQEVDPQTGKRWEIEFSKAFERAAAQHCEP